MDLDDTDLDVITNNIATLLAASELRLTMINHPAGHSRLKRRIRILKAMLVAAGKEA